MKFSFRQFLAQSPLRYWFYLFFFLQISFGNSGASNAGVRFASLCAMVEEGSFQIDSYYHLSVDWSRTPDGHYYSSKAPGPVLLAFPFFWTLDRVVTFGEADRSLRDKLRFRARGVTMPLICLLLIGLPFAYLAAYWLHRLGTVGISPLALHLTALSFLFGNTTAFFINNFFSHALVATALLGSVTLLLNSRFALSGLLFGIAVFSDYSVGVLIPPALFLFASTKNFRLRPLGQWALGGVPALVLMCGYHLICFGGPFDLPYRHVNPEFKESVDPTHSFWGVMDFFPNPQVFWEFHFGSARGFLFVMPWLLCLLAGLLWLWRRREWPGLLSRQFTLFFIPSLYLLIWVFACYGKWWHGGDSAGPRFISAVFPGLAVLFGLVYDSFPRGLRRLSLAGVLFSIIFFITVLAVLLPPDDAGPIWNWYYRKLFIQFRWVYWGRLAVLLAAFGWAFRKTRVWSLIRS